MKALYIGWLFLPIFGHLSVHHFIKIKPMILTEEKHTLIYEDLLKLWHENREPMFHHASLFSGGWGPLFYMFYYEQFIDESKDNAVTLLEQLYQNMTISADSNFTYCNGLTGPFWMLHHLNRHEFIELDVATLAEDCISMALQVSRYYLNEQNFDFLHGSSGICHVLTDFADRPDVREHLQYFVEALDAFSVMTPQGRSLPMFFYHTDPPSETGTDAFSLAHGTCSLQLLLLRIHKAGIVPELCKKLIFETMEFVLHHEEGASYGTTKSLFPSSLSVNEKPHNPSRISWCYGDVNVGLALWYCGRYFGEKNWVTKAMDIMYHSAKRDTCETGGVVDTCLCHGTGGNAAIFQRMWQETNERAFYDCAQSWFRQTHQILAFAEDPSVRGIKMWQGKNGWQHSWSLLEGSAGTGLALLSEATGKALPWDEFLLISGDFGPSSH